MLLSLHHSRLYRVGAERGDRYARENYALPEAYMGSNPFITRILIQLITEDDMWVTRRALPFRFTEGEMEVAWSVWIFNNHGMDNVPEEGVSRLLSSEMQERRGSYVRYGLAFILEHGVRCPRRAAKLLVHCIHVSL